MEIKTGEEFLKDFFNQIQNDKDLNKKVVALLVKLQAEGKLTNTNISNELDKIRKDEYEDKIDKA